MLCENSANPTQATYKIFADRVRKEVDNVFAAVENWIQEANLTALDNVIIPRVDIALRLITSSGSSGHGPNSVI